MLFTFIDRIIVPTLIAIFITGGVASFVLGCALVMRQGATLRFMAHMNRWVSTRETFARLDRRIDLDRAAVPGARRPILGTVFLLVGLAGIALVLWRLQFLSYSVARRADAQAWFFGTVAVESLKWVLVVGFAFTAVVGFLMLAAPARLAELQKRLNQWHATDDSIVAASDKVHTPLEPLVSAYPRASGWIIAIASLLMVLGMLGLASKLH
jgi:hypothetical protein